MNPDRLLERIHAVRANLDAIEADLRAAHPDLPAAPPRAAVHAGSGLPGPAPDSDLDGQYGDPEVRRDPKDWQGPSYAGARYSQCPPDYLRMLAGLLAWQARKSDEKNELANNGKPRSAYLLRDAARALGHAARIERNARPAARRPAGVTGRGSMADLDNLDGEPPF